MALFGGRRPQTDTIGLMERIGMMGRASQGGPSLQEQMRARQAQMLAEQQAVQQRFGEDRLRANLSPADGPNGSGTGAAPSIEQQMAALDEARLLNPAVAEKFAPVVRDRRMQGLLGNRPVEERLAVELNPEQAGQSYASQFKDETLAAGSVRTRGGQAIVGAPNAQRFDDRFGSFDPMTGQTSYSQPRGMTEGEITDRQVANNGTIMANRPQITNLSPGQQAFGIGPQGQASPLAANSTPAPPNPAQIEIQSQLAALDTDVDPTLSRMEQMLSSGDVVTGLGADVRLNLLRAQAAAGDRNAQRQVAATQEYQNLSGRVRVGMAKTLGTNPSNADIKLLESVTAGNIGQSTEALISTIRGGQALSARQRQSLTGRLQPQGGQPQSRGPQVGMVEDGYQYVGGDPSSPTSWRRVQ